MTRSPVRRFSFELALLALAANGCGATPPPCAVPIPAAAVDVTGEGELVAHPVGRKGGTLRLGPGGAPALLVPSGALPDEGLVISMRKAEPRPPEATGIALSVPFEISPPAEANTPHAFTFTAALPELPAGCNEERVRFAVERPNDVGPADGRGSPTLRWDYDRAIFSSPLLAAVLPKNHGHRMQFVCLREGVQ